MIRVLYLAYTIPYPPHSGYHLRVWNICRQLARRLDLSVICRSLEPPDQRVIEHAINEKVKMEPMNIPSRNVLQKGMKALSFVFKPYPIMAAGWSYKPIQDNLEDYIARNNLDIIVIEGTWLCAYWPVIAKSNALKVIDLHNLEEELLWRKAKTLSAGVTKLLYYNDALKMRYMENKIINEADLVFVTSKREKLKLAKKGIPTKIVVAPNGVDCDAIGKMPLSDHKEILFVGAMDYLPNVDGALFFANKVFPHLRRIFPELTFRIVGRSPVKDIMKLNDIEGIKVTGHVDDLELFYRRCGLCIVPLRAGGGTRLKILEAMAYGRPVVSTHLGCEGIDAEHNRHILLADKVEEIIEAVRLLLSKPELAANLVNNARQLVEEKYSWDIISETIFANYVSIIGRRP